MIRYMLRAFFQLLYHQLAWIYDLLAATVSLGRWQTWVNCAMPYLEGRVVEIGSGPGHLLANMQRAGLVGFGLEESRQMCRLSYRRIKKGGFLPKIIRSHAQLLPFPENTFDTAVTTFPAEFIYDSQTLVETWRVIRPCGRLVLLPAAWITGRGLLDRLAAWLFRMTGEVAAIEVILPGLLGRIQANGFEVQYEMVELAGSRVLVILATKPPEQSF